MKKFFAIAAVAMMALTANAQVWVGGNIGFSFDKATKNADETTTVAIQPEIGYNLNEDWAVAIGLGYITTNMDGEGGKSDKNSTAFTVSPYARYNACKMGNVTLFVDGGLEYTTFNNDGGNQISVGLRPGIAVSANEKISFVAHTGWFGYLSKSDELGGGSNFGLDITNSALSFGVYYNF